MEATYITILNWIRRTTTRENVIKKLCKYLPYTTAIAYIFILGYSIVKKQDTLLIVSIPLSAFLTVTILRKIWNRPRPYETLAIPSLFNKKKGESCPSRHTASAFSIAITGYLISPILGHFLLVLAILIAISRFIAGVHYPLDILLAILLTSGIAYVLQVIL